jgi:hypothetical protein
MTSTKNSCIIDVCYCGGDQIHQQVLDPPQETLLHVGNVESLQTLVYKAHDRLVVAATSSDSEDLSSLPSSTSSAATFALFVRRANKKIRIHEIDELLDGYSYELIHLQSLPSHLRNTIRIDEDNTPTNSQSQSSQNCGNQQAKQEEGKEEEKKEEYDDINDGFGCLPDEPLSSSPPCGDVEAGADPSVNRSSSSSPGDDHGNSTPESVFDYPIGTLLAVNIIDNNNISLFEGRMFDCRVKKYETDLLAKLDLESGDILEECTRTRFQDQDWHLQFTTLEDVEGEMLSGWYDLRKLQHFVVEKHDGDGAKTQRIKQDPHEYNGADNGKIVPLHLPTLPQACSSKKKNYAKKSKRRAKKTGPVHVGDRVTVRWVDGIHEGTVTQTRRGRHPPPDEHHAQLVFVEYDDGDKCWSNVDEEREFVVIVNLASDRRKDDSNKDKDQKGMEEMVTEGRGIDDNVSGHFKGNLSEDEDKNDVDDDDTEKVGFADMAGSEQTNVESSKIQGTINLDDDGSKDSSDEDDSDSSFTDGESDHVEYESEDDSDYDVEQHIADKKKDKEEETESC